MLATVDGCGRRNGQIAAYAAGHPAPTGFARHVRPVRTGCCPGLAALSHPLSAAHAVAIARLLPAARLMSHWPVVGMHTRLVLGRACSSVWPRPGAAGTAGPSCHPFCRCEHFAKNCHCSRAAWTTARPPHHWGASRPLAASASLSYPVALARAPPPWPGRGRCRRCGHCCSGCCCCGLAGRSDPD